MSKGKAVYDSSACDKTSNPLAAATIGGSVFVWLGSTMPKTGRSSRLEMPVFVLISKKSKIATPVVSLPVPAVVGIANKGLHMPGTGAPFPTGLFT